MSFASKIQAHYSVASGDRFVDVTVIIKGNLTSSIKQALESELDKYTKDTSSLKVKPNNYTFETVTRRGESLTSLKKSLTKDISKIIGKIPFSISVDWGNRIDGENPVDYSDKW